MFGPINFGLKYSLGPNKFWVQVIWIKKQNLDNKTIFDPRKIGLKKVMGQKDFIS